MLQNLCVFVVYWTMLYPLLLPPGSWENCCNHGVIMFFWLPELLLHEHSFNMRRLLLYSVYIFLYGAVNCFGSWVKGWPVYPGLMPWVKSVGAWTVDREGVDRRPVVWDQPVVAVIVTMGVALTLCFAYVLIMGLKAMQETVMEPVGRGTPILQSGLLEDEQDPETGLAPSTRSAKPATLQVSAFRRSGAICMSARETVRETVWRTAAATILTMFYLLPIVLLLNALASSPGSA